VVPSTDENSPQKRTTSATTPDLVDILLGESEIENYEKYGQTERPP
jgi:hypothetical protein